MKLFKSELWRQLIYQLHLLQTALRDHLISRVTPLTHIVYQLLHRLFRVQYRSRAFVHAFQFCDRPIDYTFNLVVGPAVKHLVLF